MKVLSIDLDYIMSPSIEIYNNLHYHDNPLIRWKKLYENSDYIEDNFNVNQSNLIFCYELFLKSLKESKSFSFGYEHDSILHHISEFENINLINIDHHDDVFVEGFYSEIENPNQFMEEELDDIKKYGLVTEGNWVSWLNVANKLKNYVWITNENSGHKSKCEYISKSIKNFKCIHRDELNFDDFTFDHVHVCLSPQFIPKKYWHYFSMFLIAYEEFTGNSANIVELTSGKFEFGLRYKEITNEILY